jgi:hypothetical protein
VTAATVGAQPTRLAGRGSCGGDAQERPATNPVAALPCARTPLSNPLSLPLSAPLLGPSSATVSPHQSPRAAFGLVEGDDPGRSRAKTTRDRPGSVGKQQLWRATESRWVAGAVVSGRPPTNTVGGLPADSPGHRHYPDHERWSDG